jgi:hypothetical protein
MCPTACLRPYVLDILDIVSPALTPAVMRFARRRMYAEP